MTGKGYAITPNIPLKTDDITAPAFPASPKLLINKITATARTTHNTISRRIPLSSLTFVFFLFATVCDLFLPADLFAKVH